VGFIDSYVAVAINECIQNKVDIINLSLAINTQQGSTLEVALNTAIANNIIIVAAAGENNDIENSNIAYPAQLDQVVALGEIDKSFFNSLNHSINTKVDFLMPLEKIKSCWNNNPVDNYYEYEEGSSMGTSFLTGILASALSAGVSKANIIPELKKLCNSYNSNESDNNIFKIMKL